MRLNNLFRPGNIGRMEIKNRIVMPALGTWSVEREGYMNDRTIYFYTERAKGGTGLIIVQATSVLPPVPPHLVRLDDDRFIPGLEKLIQSIHSYGARVACQIWYPGFQLAQAFHWYGEVKQELISNVLGPSPVSAIPSGVIPKEASKEELYGIIEAHGQAARRAKRAGFDAVEIHCAHGYFISSFLSPFKNRRRDEYGGSRENRARLVCEIIDRVREAVGDDFPLILRMNGSDFFPGGQTIEDALFYAREFAERGVDALHISAGTPETRPYWLDLNYFYPDGAIVHLAEAIRQAVSVPVIAVGKLSDPYFAENVIKDGKADFVAIGRGLLADAELPNKAKQGSYKDIRKCIYCNNCRINCGKQELIDSLGYGLTCTVNPALLREREFTTKPASVRKRVMIAGGGLAGMEAAYVLAQRGHKVSLYEQNGHLGGQWNIACNQPFKSGFASLTECLTRELKLAGVAITLNKRVTRKLVDKEKPDVVIVATGALPRSPDIPGVENDNVVQAVDVLAGKAKVGQRLVIIGGRNRGMEVAVQLAEDGKQVTIVTRGRLGRDTERSVYVALRDKLFESGVRLFTHCPASEIGNGGVYIADGGEVIFLEADSVVLATGARAQNALMATLRDRGLDVHAIGDCVDPRNAKEAIREGAEIGLRI